MTEVTPRELVDQAANAGRRRALIITALPLEMEAVVEHLADADSTRGGGGAVYETGRFSDANEEWLIIVSVTGAGTHPAEMAAIDAHHDFDKFDVQMVVGVAGSRKPTAPIGSVVAADQVYNPYSGKASEGTWSARPRAIPANYRLVELARKVCRKKRWLERVSGRPELKRTPPERDSTGVDPIAQVAPIVSTEAVVDDRESDLEELIASSYGDSHAVEMEGYGAQFAAHRKETPGIIVRGISDMVEGKSADEDAMNQPIAARRAAAFAFELLSEWGRAYPAEVEGVDSVRAQLEAASAELKAWPTTLPGWARNSETRTRRARVANRWLIEIDHRSPGQTWCWEISVAGEPCAPLCGTRMAGTGNQGRHTGPQSIERDATPGASGAECSTE